jgi:hypothetical protein
MQPADVSLLSTLTELRVLGLSFCDRLRTLPTSLAALTQLKVL